MVWLYLMSYLLIAGVTWLVSWILDQRHMRKKAEHKLAQANAQIRELKEEKETELELLSHDYSVMATLLEEHTTQFADIHAYLDELSGRVDQLGNIHIRIAPMQMPPEYEYAGGPSETEESYDPYPETELPDCMKDVIKAMEEIDEL